MWDELASLKPGNLWNKFKSNLDPDVVKVEARPANLVPIILFFYSAVLILTFWQEYIDKKLVFIPLSFAAVAGIFSFISYYCTNKSKNILAVLQLLDIIFYIMAILTVAAISKFPVSYLFLFIYVFMCHHYTITTRYSELFLIIITLPGFIIFAVFKPDLPVEVFLLLNLVFIRHNFKAAEEKRQLKEDKEKSQYALDKLEQLLRETQSQMEISYKLSMSDNIHNIKNKILPISLSASWLAEKIEELNVNAAENNFSPDIQQSLEALFSKSLRFEKRIEKLITNLKEQTIFFVTTKSEKNIFWVPELSKFLWKINLNELTTGDSATNVDSDQNLQQKLQIKQLPDVKINCNPHHLQTIFANLIQNSKSAGAKSIIVETKVLPQSKQVQFLIKDDGNGIPPEIIKDIFKPFITFGKKHGTGVGLFLSQQITRTNRGELKVAESSNQGTVFQLNLPLYQDITK
ncbi:MAG: ATP-binding protein [Deltaproteobacteria bacterium]|jgi:signal transduction histidine kinase|nr:ATP-binding protein [Deltaproteobacteria bacterium]